MFAVPQKNHVCSGLSRVSTPLSYSVSPRSQNTTDPHFCPLGQELHLAEGTSQLLEQQFGTIFRPICDSTRSHCCHLDKNWNSICTEHI